MLAQEKQGRATDWEIPETPSAAESRWIWAQVVAPPRSSFLRLVFVRARHLVMAAIWRKSWNMQRDDDFAPKLGRMRERREFRSGFLREVERAIARGGGRKRGGASSPRRVFYGTRIGRGAGVGRVLELRDRHAAFRSRRVVIKTRLIKLAGRSLNGARVHLRYLQRDGVTREALPGGLYDAKLDRADGAAFLERSQVTATSSASSSRRKTRSIPGPQRLYPPSHAPHGGGPRHDPRLGRSRSPRYRSSPHPHRAPRQGRAAPT